MLYEGIVTAALPSSTNESSTFFFKSSPGKSRTSHGDVEVDSVSWQNIRENCALDITEERQTVCFNYPSSQGPLQLVPPPELLPLLQIPLLAVTPRALSHLCNSLFHTWSKGEPSLLTLNKEQSVNSSHLKKKSQQLLCIKLFSDWQNRFD